MKQGGEKHSAEARRASSHCMIIKIIRGSRRCRLSPSDLPCFFWSQQELLIILLRMSASLASCHRHRIRCMDKGFDQPVTESRTGPSTG